MSKSSDPEDHNSVEITNLEQLHSAISEQHGALSKRLKQVAAWLLEHPNQAAFSTLAEIAESAGVHASTLIRFANFFEFKGFSDLQRLYKQDLLESTGDYQQRIQQVQQMSDYPSDNQAASLLQEFIKANSISNELLLSKTKPEQLSAAVEAMAAASNIHVCGFRRVYSVAHYFHYSLTQLAIKSHLVSATGGMMGEELDRIDDTSLVIAITFKPYISLTQEAVNTAKKNGAKILLITDSELCPLVNQADHLFVVREAEVRAFRSLNSTLCLAQTLCVALGYEKQQAD